MAMLVLVIGIIECAGVAFWLFRTSRQLNSGIGQATQFLTEEVEHKKQLRERLETLRGSLIDSAILKARVKELIIAKESLKAERGRVTITQAELETIEVRLRELDEISRELEASMTETKEELKILQRKEKDVSAKNTQLREQISQSLSQMDAIISQLELSAQSQAQVEKMKAELVRTEGQIQTLHNHIQEGNEQYFILKKRYDALDIEYAQLYEKFSEQQG